MINRVYEPDRIVIGGGISANFDDFAEAVRRAVSVPDPMSATAPPTIVRAQLDDPGGHGAAYLALASLEHRQRMAEKRNET